VASVTSTAGHPANIDHDLSAEGGIVYLRPGAIQPNPHQPRRRFEEGALQRLAESIQQAGLMQPIIVRPRKAKTGGAKPDDGITHELVAGERRWRAVQLAGLDTLPVIVRDLDEHQTAEWALVENLQREDLNPMERAEAFAHLIHQFGLSHEQIAQRVGVERSTISNLLRLIDLDLQVQNWVRQGRLTAGHARALVPIESKAQQQALAQKIIAQALSVRQVEQLVKQVQLEQGGSSASAPDGKLKTQARAAHLADLEEQLGRQLSTKVRIRPGRRKGSGTMSIDFYSVDQFDALLKRLEIQAE
jgi:ParB family chromosome partitioning protein